MLASASPRRRDLLTALLDSFEVRPADIPEDAGDDPQEAAARLAREKALAVAAADPDAVIIGSDTIVHDGTRSFGKPLDANEAVAMWSALRGREHRVFTGVAVAARGGVATLISESAVELADLPDETVAAYVASGRPLDKAGAYAIQDEDVPTISGLSGCYCGVMGLPLWKTKTLLERAGVACRAPDSTYSRCATCPERP